MSRSKTAKVTRIAYSKNLTESKYTQLGQIATMLAPIRRDVWHRYGSVQGVGKSARDIRAELKPQRTDSLPYKLWATTVLDVASDIKAYREAAKFQVRKAIRNRAEDDEERKRLYTLLKSDKWLEDSYLRRQMRKHFKHGHTQVDNQIVLDPELYNVFELGGKAWIKVMSLERGKRIAIPLNTTVAPSGTLRLILKDNRVEVHYSVDSVDVCSIKPCGEDTVGVDKGYTETFTDSDGKAHGEGLGKMLSAESDYLKVKYQRRGKLHAIAKKSPPHKRKKIERNNLGRKKLDARKKRHAQNVRDKVYKATHSVVDKASTVVVEDLTAPIKSKKKYRKDQKRRLSVWVKGLMAEALDSVSQRRGASLSIVNAAYTSQTDSRYGILLGERNGDRFTTFDGVVLDADTNAARNILARLNDPEIGLYTPYKKVKKVLLERTEQFKRLGPLNQDTSCTLGNETSTVSESPDVHIWAYL